MAEKEFDPEDPFTLTGCVLSLPPDQARLAQEEMAACFIEEYLLMGYDADRILALFKEPFYQATHEVYRAYGESYVRDLIQRVSGGPLEPQAKESPHVPSL